MTRKPEHPFLTPIEYLVLRVVAVHKVDRYAAIKRLLPPFMRDAPNGTGIGLAALLQRGLLECIRREARVGAGPGTGPLRIVRITPLGRELLKKHLPLFLAQGRP